MVLALLALITGIYAGLNRIGWQTPLPQPALAGAHGPLMVAGVLGTVVSLERAVALRRRWSYAAPLLHGLGGMALILGVPGRFGPLLFVLGGLVLVMIFAVLLRAHPAKYTLYMTLGAAALLIGNTLWLAGQPFFSMVGWWSLFLILTIAGERLELGRLRQLPARVERRFAALALLLLIGTGATLILPDAGVRMAGVAALGLAAWLLRYDIARRTIRKTGLTRFIAVCLLSGYVWLGLGGLTAAVYGFTPAGPIYDAMLHMIFVGFTFAMIFGHAPIIVPAVLGLPMRFSHAFYAPLALLHLSLVLRVVGDLAGFGAIRRWGGLLNAVTLLAFLLVAGWAMLAARGGLRRRAT
jgi:hypothetical protein